jgi:hypothetical protein
VMWMKRFAEACQGKPAAASGPSLLVLLSRSLRSRSLFAQEEKQRSKVIEYHADYRPQACLTAVEADK